MRTGNPVLNAQTFMHFGSTAIGNRISIQGTVNKTFILLGILLLTSVWVWEKVFSQEPVGLMVTLVWLYTEILRLVSKFRSQR